MNAQTETPTRQVRNPAHGSADPPKKAEIHARDIMMTDVVTVGPDESIHDIAALLSEKDISAVPVVKNSEILGIVSEGDLICRQELGTDQGGNDPVKSHGTCAREVMTSHVATVSDQTPLGEIVEILLSTRIKRVLVAREGKLVGIVSRSDIVRALAARPEGAHEPLSCDDDIIRYRVVEALLDIAGTSPWLTTVKVSNGVVELHGCLEDETKYEVSRLAVANIPGVVEVRDHRTTLQPYWG